MDDASTTTATLDQADEEILSYTSDEALEATAGSERGPSGEPMASRGPGKEPPRDSRHGMFHRWMAILAQGGPLVRNHGLSRGSRPMAKR